MCIATYFATTTQRGLHCSPLRLSLCACPTTMGLASHFPSAQVAPVYTLHTYPASLAPLLLPSFPDSFHTLLWSSNLRTHGGSLTALASVRRSEAEGHHQHPYE